ncbi:Ca2+-binding EF-hand superfamily protein [Crossiella equi]|uniref:Ca2+-binding EF-hand superfamily protein n=1 Tax=Crossiella equi TaxID=130796 RepID=A0ABS5AP08_9PSEU|nr:EF-hand domain-containing protein [Crossiella equi]MBP2478313.1 Ca2+-binding EF-hand superfamily protein [Crossiella equi]
MGIQDSNLGKIFDALDINQDGVLEESDFLGFARQLAPRLAPGAEVHRQEGIITAFEGWWHQILRDGDANGDGRVTRVEYVTATARGLVANPDYLDEAYSAVAEAVFQALDTDDDGSIDRAEYLAMYAAANVGEDIAGTAFDRIDRNGDGVIDYAEFRAAVQELFTTDDPEAVGAELLG